MNHGIKIAALTLLTLSVSFVNAQSKEEALTTLSAIVANAKAKGIPKASEELSAGTDASKCKEKAGLNCMIATTDGNKQLGNAKNAKMVGTEFPPDFSDVDGTPIVAQLIGPLKSGKTKWEAHYKFAAPGTKKITPQHAFCEKLDATTLACATLINAQ